MGVWRRAFGALFKTSCFGDFGWLHVKTAVSGLICLVFACLQAAVKTETATG